VTGYLPVAIFLALIVAFGVVSLLAAKFVRPRRPYAMKSEIYECGAETFGAAWTQFPVGFYLVALVFIVCDAAVVFLFPWVLLLHEPEMSATALAGMGAFFAIVSLGWLYAYREGILEWK
jgi:NADH-quinone oxidoreductase subunit A